MKRSPRCARYSPTAAPPIPPAQSGGVAGLASPQYHDEAAAALRQVLTNRRTTGRVRQDVARSLAGMGPQYHDEAVAALRQVLTNRRARVYDRHEAAESLAGLGPQYHDEAVAALRRMLTNRRARVYEPCGGG